MRFQVGDRVVVPEHGVGSIVGLAEQQFMQATRAWYYEVATAKSTVWVPAEAPKLGLRAVASERDLARCSRRLKSAPVPIEGDHHHRRAEVTRRLRGGDLITTAEVVRDLSALEWRRPLPEADAALLRRARERLCEEWAAARNISVAEALDEVNQLLAAGRRKHNKPS